MKFPSVLKYQLISKKKQHKHTVQDIHFDEATNQVFGRIYDDIKPIRVQLREDGIWEPCKR